MKTKITDIHGKIYTEIIISKSDKKAFEDMSKRLEFELYDKVVSLCLFPEGDKIFIKGTRKILKLFVEILIQETTDIDKEIMFSLILKRLKDKNYKLLTDK